MEFKPFFIPSLLIVLMLILPSCDGNNINSTLNYAEENMMESPEVVLDTLEKIDASKIKSDKEKALYALLLTQARDKNNRFEKNDTLISSAVDYYDNHLIKDDKNRMLAHFYKGVINFYAKEYSRALYESLVALSLTDDSDNFYKGKIHDLMSDLYTSSFNLTTAVKNRKLAVDYYNKANKKLFAFYAVDDLARNLLHIDSIDQVKNIIDSLYAIDDPELIPHRPIVNISNMYYYLNVHKYKNALKIFCDSALYKHPSFILAHASPIAYMFAANNLPDSAMRYMKLEEKNNPDYLWNPWYNKANYELSRQKGDYKEMYKKYLFRDSIGDILLKRALDRNVALQEAEFYYSQKLIAEKSKNTWMSVAIIVGLGSIVVVLLLVIYLQKVRYRHLQTEQRLREFVSQKDINNIIPINNEPVPGKEDPSSELQSKSNDNINEKTEAKESSESYNGELKDLISEVIEMEFEPIRTIANQYFKRDTSDKRKKELKKELDKVVERINSEKEASIIERLTNSINNGIIAELKEEMPNLNAREIRYIIYELSNCNNNMMALLFDSPQGSIRMIKTRLYGKAVKSGSKRVIELLDKNFKTTSNNVS